MSVSLASIGGMGLFVRSSRAIAQGRADIGGIHKRRPVHLPLLYARRCSSGRIRATVRIEPLPGPTHCPPARVGTSAAQGMPAADAPCCGEIEPLGEPDTRVKSSRGPYERRDTAAAGLSAWSSRTASRLCLHHKMLPAPGHGALGVSAARRAPTRRALSPLNHAGTAACVRWRAFRARAPELQLRWGLRGYAGGAFACAVSRAPDGSRW